MKPTRLTDEERSILENPGSEDEIILEIIKGMEVDEMRRFDVYTPLDMEHYKNEQMKWLETEKSLLYERPCNCHHEVSEELLIEDFEKCHNGERFRVFYVFKYMSKVKRIFD